MYAIYQYNAGASQANVLSDLVAVFTGETDKTNLSAACDQANTTITSDVAAGWTLHDAGAGTNKQVIRAPYADSAAFKYAEIEIPSVTKLTVYGYETFDESTHAGVNKTANPTSPYQRTNLTSGGRFYLFSSARFLAICGEYGSYWGDSSNGGPFLVAEYSRMPPWNTAASGYPAFAVVYMGGCFQGSVYAWMPRAKNRSGADVTGSSAVCYAASIGASPNSWSSATYYPNGADAKIPDGTGNSWLPFMPIFLQNPNVFSIPVGDISSVSSVWAAPCAAVGNLEVVPFNGTDYIALQAHNSSLLRLLFRMG